MNSIFVQPVISDERAVFYRERAAGMYAVEPWYLAMVRASASYAAIPAQLLVCSCIRADELHVARDVLFEQMSINLWAILWTCTLF